MKTGIVANSTLCLPLLYFLKSQQENFAVFSAEENAQNGGAVGSFCSNAGIQCTNGNNNPNALYEWVLAYQSDIVFVIGYNRLIKAGRFGNHLPELFNVHFGQLPEYRGPNPVFWQLKKGSHTLGLCIHRISERLDAGEVVWKREYTNEPFFSYGYVHQLMSHYVVEGVHCLLQMKKQGQHITGTEQDEQKAGYFYRPAAKDVCIQWQTMCATEICNLVKACNPWNNGAISIYNGFEVRINDAEWFPANAPFVQNCTHGAAAGTIICTDKRLLVSCTNNEVINIHTLTVNGVLMPGRFAAHYGFLKNQLFTSF